jgi:hypothetical protein
MVVWCCRKNRIRMMALIWCELWCGAAGPTVATAQVAERVEINRSLSGSMDLETRFTTIA